MLWFVLLAFVGAILGYVFFDPGKGRHSVGAGMGGFIGLAIGILLRVIFQIGKLASKLSRRFSDDR